MAAPTANASWRDSARFPKFFGLDSRAVFPFFIFLVNIAVWTFVLSFVTMVFFSVLMRYGFNLGTFLRFIRTSLAGKRKVAKPWWVYGYY